MSSPERKRARKEKRKSVEITAEVKAAKVLNGGSLTSDLLPENLWPETYDKETLNKITFKMAMKLRKLQDSNKEEDERAPGVSISKPDKPMRTVHVSAGPDNATDILHPDRFRMRPVIAPPKGWWVANMEKKRKDAPSNPNVAYLGAAQQVIKSVFTLEVV